ncbi:peptide deformylase, mitochondrial-like [Zerene cesonia]|uniref:peptide deformylase, mitochondrial-like n=1 Tax=Zerene cesonia TaxID=33412 RepID=UPI0018E59D0B|nr:peptide deformylase, mitochondrial-like [Zerene cesonia]
MGILRKTLNWYAKLSPSRGKVNPPYEHIVQIGDPRLRKICEEVPLEAIKTNEIQKLILILEHMLIKYGSVGMSAPQVGINKRIFVMRHTAKQIKSEPPEIVKSKNMYEVPFTVFINPVVKILDYNKVIFTEGCESIKSFQADVARHKSVEVTGYNADGEQSTKQYSGWPARIVQHEMDHLNGKLYTDIMDRKTLQCVCWEEINLSKGKVAIPYSP